MLGLFTCLLILGFASQCQSVGTKISFHNVLSYGARGNGRSDDSRAFLSAWQQVCGAEGRATLVIPPNRVFRVTNLVLDGPCKAKIVHIQIQGKIVAPSKIGWRGQNSNMIRISYVNTLIIDGGGQLDGFGSTWWMQPKTTRPVILSLHACTYLVVKDLSFTNSPGAHVAVNAVINAKFSHIYIHAPPNSPNTDGFDIASSRNILIEDTVISTGDDCIAINGGTYHVDVTRVTCGPGHGISIGSLGRDNGHEIVEDVHVQNSTIISTTNGARIKTCEGGSGYARNITFEQIILKGVENAIIIDQHYGPRGNKETSAVKVSDVTYRGFKGTSSRDLAIKIDCSSFGCFNIVLDGINIGSSQPGRRTHASCKNAHGATIINVAPTVSC